MKRTAMLMVAIMFCSAIALGFIEEAQEPATTTDGTSWELTHPATEEPYSPLVYCGAGMGKSVDEVGSLFFEEYGISINYNYAGSNTFLSQMELVQRGDTYIPGATYYFDIAKEKGITDYEQRVAYHVPVIAVPEGKAIFEKHGFTAYPGEKYGDD